MRHHRAPNLLAGENTRRRASVDPAFERTFDLEARWGDDLETLRRGLRKVKDDILHGRYQYPGDPYKVEPRPKQPRRPPRVRVPRPPRVPAPPPTDAEKRRNYAERRREFCRRRLAEWQERMGLNGD